MITVGSAGTGMTGSPAEIIAGASGCMDLSRTRVLPPLAAATFRIRLIMERGLMRQRIGPGSELILEEGERDKLGEATPRAPQGPEATAARTSASCVDDVDDDQGVAIVEIGDRHHRGAGRRSCPGARSPWFAAKASVLR